MQYETVLTVYHYFILQLNNGLTGMQYESVSGTRTKLEPCDHQNCYHGNRHSVSRYVKINYW